MNSHIDADAVQKHRHAAMVFYIVLAFGCEAGWASLIGYVLWRVLYNVFEFTLHRFLSF